MRKVQINIQMQIVNDETGELNHITTYADSNNLWATICGGFKELLSALHEAGYPLEGVMSTWSYD